MRTSDDSTRLGAMEVIRQAGGKVGDLHPAQQAAFALMMGG